MTATASGRETHFLDVGTTNGHCSVRLVGLWPTRLHVWHPLHLWQSWLDVELAAQKVRTAPRCLVRSGHGGIRRVGSDRMAARVTHPHLARSGCLGHPRGASMSSLYPTRSSGPPPRKISTHDRPCGRSYTTPARTERPCRRGKPATGHIPRRHFCPLCLCRNQPRHEEHTSAHKQPAQRLDLASRGAGGGRPNLSPHIRGI